MLYHKFHRLTDDRRKMPHLRGADVEFFRVPLNWKAQSRAWHLARGYGAYNHEREPIRFRPRFSPVLHRLELRRPVV